MNGTDPDRYNLTRFLHAQDQVYRTVLDELTHGRKESHWMWFIFPQLRGLGQSSMAQFFGIESVEEARAYVAHPQLGPRLDVTTRLAIDAPAPDVHVLFGTPDDLKFRSSMTLFAQAAPPDARHIGVFQQALDRWFDGEPDAKTLSLIARMA